MRKNLIAIFTLLFSINLSAKVKISASDAISQLTRFGAGLDITGAKSLSQSDYDLKVTQAAIISDIRIVMAEAKNNKTEINLDQQDSDGFTGLIRASIKGHYDVVEFLISHGAGQKKVNYISSLYNEAVKAKKNPVYVISSDPKDTNTISSFLLTTGSGVNAFMAAAGYNRMNILKYLVKFKDKDGNKLPINDILIKQAIAYLPCRLNDKTITQKQNDDISSYLKNLLLAPEFNILLKDGQDKDGWTRLMRIVEKSNSTVDEFKTELLKHPDQFSLTTPGGQNVLDIAAEHKRLHILKFLIENNNQFGIQITYAMIDSAITYAVKVRNVPNSDDAIKYLLDINKNKPANATLSTLVQALPTAPAPAAQPVAASVSSSISQSVSAPAGSTGSTNSINGAAQPAPAPIAQPAAGSAASPVSAPAASPISQPAPAPAAQPVAASVSSSISQPVSAPAGSTNSVNGAAQPAPAPIAQLAAGSAASPVSAPVSSSISQPAAPAPAPAAAGSASASAASSRPAPTGSAAQKSTKNSGNSGRGGQAAAKPSAQKTAQPSGQKNGRKSK